MILLSILASHSISYAAPLKKSLDVGLSGKYPPFNYFDESGKLAGFDVEVAESLCEKLGRQCTYKILQWDGITAALIAKKVDVIIGSMAITPERAKSVAFSTPYYESGAQLFTRNSTHGGSPGQEQTEDPQAEGFSLGVVLGTTYGEAVEKKYPHSKIRVFKSELEAVEDLAAERLGGVITNRLVGSYINKKRGGILKENGPLIDHEKIAIAVHPDNQQLLTDINSALKAILISKAYKASYNRYFSTVTTDQSDPTALNIDWVQTGILLLKGLWATTQIALCGLVLGGLLAVLLSFGLMAPYSWIQFPTRGIVDFVRATPFVIQLFGVYFGLPAVGLKLGAWSAAVLTISVHVSAFLSESFKSAFLSVPRGQRQAAKILGLSRRQTVWYVVLPQMLPILTVPTLNTLVALIKDSAIVSVISVYELTMQTQQLISATFRPLEFYSLTAVLYASLTYPLILVGRWQEKKYKTKGLSDDLS
jgi:His/Glu/Gln/Arg/opine family amino acid ABC transporter permease subunit